MKLLTLLLLVIPQFIFSKQIYSGKDSLYFFTSDILFVPTESSILESRVGVTKFIDKKYLKLDIGVSFDLIGLKVNQSLFSMGVDFFTFSNLRNEANFKFPVDAIDYLFGFNFNFKKYIKHVIDLASRFRISHISSHLEDGHIYSSSDSILIPFVFSKEFMDLAFIITYKLNSRMQFRSLLALNYIFHAIPKDIKRLSAQEGLELDYFLTKIVSFYISNDLTLAAVNSQTNVNVNFQTGFSIGGLNTRAVNIYFNYFDGQDYKGQYYGRFTNYKGLGLRFKF